MGRTRDLVLALIIITGGLGLCTLVFVAGQRLGVRPGLLLHAIFLVVLTSLMCYCYSHYRRGSQGARLYLPGLGMFVCGAGIFLASDLLMISRPFTSLGTGLGLTLEILGAILAIRTYWRREVGSQ